MNLAELNKVAEAMVAPGRGILAADESSGTIKKRFDAINVPSTEETRRDYREMLFRATEAMSKYISGVILYDETIWQDANDGTPLIKLIEQSGAIPGIKVDEGTQAFNSRMVFSATSSMEACFGHFLPETTMLGLRIMPSSSTRWTRNSWNVLLRTRWVTS